MQNSTIVALDWMDTFLFTLIVILFICVNRGAGWLFCTFAIWKIIKSAIILEGE